MKFLIIFCLAAVSVHAQFSASAQKEIVTYINDLRSLVASRRFHLDSRDVETLPPASDMLKMTWNSTLAVAAQKLAKTCFIAVESSSPGIADKRIVAANVVTVAKNALGHWKHSLNKEWNLKSYNSNYIGIQLIWAKSSSVGCGFSPCEIDSQGRRWYKVVCSFEKKGGITREPVYKKGKACEACPAGTKCASGSVLCS
ncbi:SCP domain-containing protein [Caenorhabditis elegans]|uniref:SCP domain-containing protein n=1 Tax=Caenorhabditis elegans TaxID=6239 RepID=Q9XWX3_CAEEL|nr:SCP domain-containing protein [Caenorhabditis elegans]CAA21513.1 SCP domain-containing protein [Caenorhabditis elegans]|eukprot:NP_507793.1 SCP-Like extracellular protein [Caenorhabditis elegans]